MKTPELVCLRARLRHIAVSMLMALIATCPVASSRADEPGTSGSARGRRAGYALVHGDDGRTHRPLSSTPGLRAPGDRRGGCENIARPQPVWGGPLRAEIVQSKKDGDQTVYEMKFVFPRGDATSLFFGFDGQDKITGVAPAGLAGD